MNGHGCIKFLLAVLVLAVIYFGWVITGALDRVRESNQRVLERLEHLEQQLQNQVFSPAALRPGETGTAPAPPAAGSNIANRQYFDPAAVPGGRLLQATMADTPNLNPLINNEATASEFYGLCVPALAELDYADPTEYQPMLAESWEISPDHRSYRIKLRRGFQFFIEVVKNPDVNCEAIRTYYQDLESIEIVNDFEFIVRWKVEYYGSRSSTLGMSPMPRHFYHAYDGPFDGKRFNNDHRRNRMLIGCGPYRSSAATPPSSGTPSASAPRSNISSMRLSNTPTPGFRRCSPGRSTGSGSLRISGSSGPAGVSSLRASSKSTVISCRSTPTSATTSPIPAFRTRGCGRR